MSEKSLLITGSNGYIARFLIKELRKHGDLCIFGIDRHEESANQGITYFKGDLCDQMSSRHVLAECKPQYIIHLASTFDQEPGPAFQINVQGSQFLLENILSLQLTPAIFFAGSAAEYGLQEDSDQAIYEHVAANPSSIYGLTKLLQSTLAIGFSRIHRLNLIVGRIFNLIGPNIPAEFIIGRITRQIEAIRQGQSTILHLRHIDSTRDFIDIRDVVKIIWRLITIAGGPDIVNIGSGIPVSIKNLVDIFIQRTGLADVATVETSAEKTSDRSYSVADCTKLKTYYDESMISLEDSIDYIFSEQSRNWS
jgi:GDP-4-dehydro-6-deoxy-D-mannose reductase